MILRRHLSNTSATSRTDGNSLSEVPVLLILLLALTGIFGVVLWLVSLLLQGWLYSDIASKLPLRALAGGAALALFHTGWCAVYKVDPGRFDTLYSFKTEALDGKYDEFQSVRKVGKNEQKPVKYSRIGESTDFESSESRKHWNRSDADGMMVAILIQEKGKDKPTRFDANLSPDGKFRPRNENKYETDGGKRYMDEISIGNVYRKRSFAVMGNLFANLLHLALWAAVLWPVMRFALGHAIGFGLALWAITMILQPALFGIVTKGAL